jgi:hypothetical protein
VDFTRTAVAVDQRDAGYGGRMGQAVLRAARRDRRAGSLRAARLAAATLLLGALAGCGQGAQDASEPEDVAEAGTDVTTLDAPAPEPLVTATPDEFSEVGDLVEGFPIDLLPVPGDAVILVTSAVPVGDADVQEVSLNLRTSATADEILELYRTALTEAGFDEVTAETTDSDLAAEVTFVRSGGDEVVTIGVLDVDGARTVTIGGRVRTAE